MSERELFAMRASVIEENSRIKTLRGIEFEDRIREFKAAIVFLGWSLAQ
jgi:hypothetical protein